MLKHRDEILKVRDDIVKERNRLFDELVKIPGLTVYPSCTNFLLVQVENKHEEIFKALKAKDILVKIYRNSAELPEAYRISVTTKDVDDTLLEVFRKELS